MPKSKGDKKVNRLAAILTLTIDPRLKDAIGRAADEEGLAMNEWVAKLAAKALGLPDLARIPRKPLGRPRNESAAAS